MDDFDIGAAVEATAETMDLSGGRESDTPKEETKPQETTQEIGAGTAAAPASTPAATPAAAPAGTKPTETTAGKDGAPPPAPPPGQLKAPQSWRPEAQQTWETLPEAAKQEILKREEDVLRGLGQYKEAANYGQNVQRVIAPFVPLMRQHNVDPVQHIGTLMQIHAALVTGSPDVKANIFTKLAQDYGINLGQIASPEDNPYVDPEVTRLQRELQELKFSQERMQAARMTEVRNNLAAELDAFYANPEHIYADEVANDMARLIQSGNVSTLKQAYENAIWLNPTVRQKMLEAQQKTQQQAQQQAAAERTTAARSATGVNVKSNSVDTGNLQAPQKSMDETLQETLRKIQARK